MKILRPGAVTIGIPTWNRRGLLQKAVESALNQTYPDLEIVISDDGSTDGSAEYIESISDARVVKHLKPKNEGLVANFNTCLNAASSEFFLMLNHDDSLSPTAVEKLVNGFLNPPNNVPSSSVGISWCAFINVDEEGNDLWEVRGGPPVESAVDLIEGIFNGTRGPFNSGIMIRTMDALAVGGYDRRYESLCDSALWGQVALRNQYSVCIDGPLMGYLISTSSATAVAECAVWQEGIKMQVADFVNVLRDRGDEAGAHRLLRAGNHALANITATILLRFVGRPGWMTATLGECWRSRKYLCTPFAVCRAIRDGWKLVRLANSNGSRRRTATAAISST